MAKNNIYICPEQVSLFAVSYDQDVSDWPGNHSHPFWELILFERGNGTHFINDTAYPFMPGNMALLSPTDFHHWINEDGMTHDCFKAKFAFGLYNSRFSKACNFPQFPAVSNLCDMDFEKALQIFRILNDENNESDLSGNTALSMDLIESLLILLCRNLPSSRQAQQESYGNSRKILMYIQEHFTEPITVSDAAKALNYSPKYFSRLFSREFGVAFQEYLKVIRLNYAYHLLKHSDHPVIDICYSSGFRSPTYFSTAFKEKFGISPSQLRKNM